MCHVTLSSSAVALAVPLSGPGFPQVDASGLGGW